MKINEFIHSKIVIIGLVIISSIMVVITGTYAWFTWSSSDNTSLTMTIGGLGDVTFDKGNAITSELKPVFNYNEGESTTFSVTNKLTNGETAKYSVYLNLTSIPSEFRSEGVKYVLVKDGTKVREGNLSMATDGSSIRVYTSKLDSSTANYVFYLYIDGNLENTTSMINKTIVGELTVEQTEVETLVTHINNLYMNNKDATPVTNNGIEYTYASIYDKDTDSNTSGGLMNDRLGGTTSNYDAGNIRYYGKNPLNYIDIGDVYTEDVTIDNFEKNKLFLEWMWLVTDRDSCYAMMDCETNYEGLGFPDSATCQAFLGTTDTEELCGTEEKKAGDPKLYRIIGLFKDIEKTDGTTEDLVKIIREDSIGEFAWDLVSDDSGYAYSNDWNNSTLSSILNNEYFNSQSVNHDYFELGQIWDYVNVTTDLSKKGLNSSVHNKIESVKWNLGGCLSTISIYADQIYGYERGEAKCTNCNYEPTWTGKIALMYPSDYGYAVDFNRCGNELSAYNAENCFNSSWLYGASNGAVTEYLLTPHSDHPNYVWHVDFENYVFGDALVYHGNGVRPVLFLNSELVIETGEGSETNPYVVG